MAAEEALRDEDKDNPCVRARPSPRSAVDGGLDSDNRRHCRAFSRVPDPAPRLTSRHRERAAAAPAVPRRPSPDPPHPQSSLYYYAIMRLYYCATVLLNYCATTLLYDYATILY